MPELPLAPIDRIFHRAGAERVSEDAVQALRDILETIAFDIANKSIELARHAGRKTVTADDVKIAIKIIRCIPLATY